MANLFFSPLMKKSRDPYEKDLGIGRKKVFFPVVERSRDL